MIQVKVSQHLSIQHIFILPADKINVYWYLVISSTNNKLHGDAEDMPTITTVYVPVIKSVSTQVFWKWARVARVASDCRLGRNCAATLAPLSLPLHYLAVARARCQKSGRPQGRCRRGVFPPFSRPTASLAWEGLGSEIQRVAASSAAAEARSKDVTFLKSSLFSLFWTYGEGESLGPTCRPITTTFSGRESLSEVVTFSKSSLFSLFSPPRCAFRVKTLALLDGRRQHQASLRSLP